MVSNSEHTNKALKLLAYCVEISTRFLLESSVNPNDYSLEFSDTGEEFMDAVEKHAHQIYIIDASANEGDDKLRFFNQVTEKRYQGLRRVVLLMDKPMPPEANQMLSFGPLCFLEGYFTKARLAETLKQSMEIKDTGVRVKADPKFFDITKFKV